MRRFIAHLIFLCAIASTAQGACTTEQTLFMQCAIEGKETEVSVCFDDSTVHYNFGPIGALPDLALSTQFEPGLKYTPWSGAYREVGESLQFYNDGYGYNVIFGMLEEWPDAHQWGQPNFGLIPSFTDTSPEFGQVVVTRGGDILQTLDCDPQRLQWRRNALFDALHDAQFKWGVSAGSPLAWYDDSTYPYSGLPKSEGDFTCPYEETRQINFSSSEVQDTLRIKIVGDDCDTSLIVLSIETLAGEIVHNSSARALSYTYEYEGADGVRAMLLNFINDYYADPANIVSYQEMIESGAYADIDQPLLAQVRAEELPVFCHQTGKSNGRCFVYKNGGSTLLFSSGS